MAERPWRIWVTRARPAARATADALRAQGHLPLVAPLIAVRTLAAAPPDLEGVSALAFTSAAGVRAFAALTARRDRPVFAVGRATAAAARAAGFAAVTDADGGGRDLADLIAAAPPAAAVLVPGARAPAFDLPSALAAAGVEARPLALYAAERVDPPPRRALALLAAGRLDAVTLQSAGAARALGAAAADLAVARPPLVLALSDACRPAALPWPGRTAAAPRERDLLALAPRLDRPAPAR